MRQLKEKTNLLVLLLTIFSLSFCTALDEATTTEDSTSGTTTGTTTSLSADCTAASATSVYSVFSDIEGAQDVNADAGWYPTYDGSDTTVALDDASGPKCGNVAAKATRTKSSWMAGGVALTADWSSYDTLKVWVKADSSTYTANGLKFKLSDTDTNNDCGGSDNVGDTVELSVDDYGFTADGTWQLVKFPITDFCASLVKANIDNFIWVNNGLDNNEIVYFDEIYVDASGESTKNSSSGGGGGGIAAPTAGPSDPNVSGGLVVYSEASGGTNKNSNLSPGSWFTGIVPTEETLDDGKKVRKHDYASSDWQIQVIDGNLDISSKTFYTDVYSMGETKLNIVFESGTYPNNPQKSCTVNVTAGQWTTVSLDNSTINSCADAGNSGGAGTFANNAVTIVHIKTDSGATGKVFYIDNIYAK